MSLFEWLVKSINNIDPIANVADQPEFNSGHCSRAGLVCACCIVVAVDPSEGIAWYNEHIYSTMCSIVNRFHAYRMSCTVDENKANCIT